MPFTGPYAYARKVYAIEGRCLYHGIMYHIVKDESLTDFQGMVKGKAIYKIPARQLIPPMA